MNVPTGKGKPGCQKGTFSRHGPDAGGIPEEFMAGS